MIITEGLVLVAFGWRFWLDRTLNDLKDEIEAKGTVLESLQDQEDEIRLLQQKMDIYKDLWYQSSSYAPVFKEVNSYLPVDAEELTVSISKDEVGTLLTIEGIANGEDIDQMENQVKDSDTFVNRQLGKVEREEVEANLYSFSIFGYVKFNTLRTSVGNYEITEPAAE